MIAFANKIISAVDSEVGMVVMSLLPTMLCAWLCIWYRFLEPRFSQKKSKCDNSSIEFLRAFRWFLSPETRETVDLVIADLKRDKREMQNEKRSEILISSVMLWRSEVCFLNILWHGILKLILRMLPVWPMVKYLRRWL